MRHVLGAMFAVFLWLSGSANAFADQPKYWQVGGSSTEVWSLVDDSFVLVSNAAYLAWLSAGNTATRITSNAELFDVLQSGYPDHLSASAPHLDASGGLTPLQAFSWRKQAGLTITYTGAPSLNGRYPVDDQWLGGLMTGALLRCGSTALSVCSTPFPFNMTTYTYLDKDFIAHSMSITQMRVIVLAIQDQVASLYAQLQLGLSGGTPSWPSLSVIVP